MVRITIKNNQGSKTVNAEISQTPAAIFSEVGIQLAGSMVTLNGMNLTASDLNQPLENLGVADGSQNNYMSAIVKADGANI